MKRLNPDLLRLFASFAVDSTQKDLITIDQAIEKLGLVPFDKFTPPPHAPEGRATGRTTRMLVEAAIASQSSPVMIQGWSDRYSYSLTIDCRKMCIKLGLDPERILFRPQSRQKPDVDYLIFHDHYQR